MNDYIKYNPADESTFPEDGTPILCAVLDRAHNNWGVDAGFADGEIVTIWNERFKDSDVYWCRVYLPEESQYPFGE